MSSDPGETSALSGSPTHPNRKNYEARQRRHQQRCRPTCGCLMITVAFTLLGTAALSASIFTDYWERIDYNASSIESIARRNNGSHRLTWLFNKTVARIAFNPTSSSYPTPYLSTTSTTKVARATKWNATSSAAAAGLLEKPFGAPSYVQFGAIERLQEVSKVKWISQPEEVFNKSLVRRRKHIQQRRKKRSRRSLSLFYLIPLHGGIWHLCVDLQHDQLRMLQEMGLDRDKCTEYMDAAGIYGSDIDDIRLTPNFLHHHVQSKMHNLSISCAMVCVILLASAALLGTFGIIKRQISAVLITGVMYILAALFAVFSLVIMHCKRNTRRETGIVDDPLINTTEYNEARIFTNSWSMLLGWAGSVVILVASLFWLFLAKVMRYNQLTFF